MEYFKVPWHSEILCRPVAQIRTINIKDSNQAQLDFDVFLDWKTENNIQFSSARVLHDHIAESTFLQNFGYQFVELNYRPEINLTNSSFKADDQFDFSEAQPNDEPVLVNMAGQIFTRGRFHQDLKLGAEPGNIRYRHWMKNAFKLPHQKIIKCTENNDIVAFFVVENPSEQHSFWSLVGLAPGLSGQGLGKKVWTSMLRWQQSQAIEQVSTSISSLNQAVFNLYTRLGFRFPIPEVTFHWHANTPGGQ